MLTLGGCCTTKGVSSSPAKRRRVEFYDKNSNRTGYGIIEGNRIDFYDKNSNHTGYGIIRNGEVEYFDLDSNRLGSSKAR